MANESTIPGVPFGQLPSFESLYGDEGKFAPDPTFEDRKRAEAEAQGLRFSGDVGIGPKFLEFIKNVPDAGYEFFARGFEGLGELAVGTALAGYKGGKLLLEPDPEKRREIMAEPAFTKYMGEFRGKLGSLDLAENTISGITPEQVTNVLGYYVGAPTSVLGGAIKAPFLASKAVQGTKAATEGTKNVVEDVVKSFTRGDSGFRASAGGSKLDNILMDIGPEKLKEFRTYRDLSKFIKDKYNFSVSPSLLGTGKKNVQIGQRSPVDEKFINFFKEQKSIIDALGKNKSNQSLNALLELDKDFILRAKNKELIDYLATKGVKATDNEMAKIRNLYKKYVGEKPYLQKDTRIFNLNDTRITDILEDVRLGNIKKYEAAAKLEDMFPRSGLTDKFGFKTSVGQPVTTQKFSDLYKDFLDQLPEGVPKQVFKEGSSKKIFADTKIGEKVPSGGLNFVRASSIFDDSGKTFSQTKASFLDNEIAKDFLDKGKNLFKNKNTKIFEVDHIQAPRFGGTNAESNLRLITRADHTTLKMLPKSKTSASDVVKAKSGFEDEYYKLSTRLIDNVKKNNFKAAKEVSKSLKALVSNFKNTYKNTDFIVGQPHVAIKTGDNTVQYVKYSDDVKLSNKQKKFIDDNNLLPEYSNLPNAGKNVDKQAEQIYTNYLQIYNLIGEIPKNIKLPGKKVLSPTKDFATMRDGGIATMEYMTRPLDGTR